MIASKLGKTMIGIEQSSKDKTSILDGMMEESSSFFSRQSMKFDYFFIIGHNFII